jgi:hypothetical protein
MSYRILYTRIIFTVKELSSSHIMYVATHFCDQINKLGPSIHIIIVHSDIFT